MANHVKKDPFFKDEIREDGIRNDVVRNDVVRNDEIREIYASSSSSKRYEEYRPDGAPHQFSPQIKPVPRPEYPDVYDAGVAGYSVVAEERNTAGVAGAREAAGTSGAHNFDSANTRDVAFGGARNVGERNAAGMFGAQNAGAYGQRNVNMAAEQAFSYDGMTQNYIGQSADTQQALLERRRQRAENARAREAEAQKKRKRMIAVIVVVVVAIAVVIVCFSLLTCGSSSEEKPGEGESNAPATVSLEQTDNIAITLHGDPNTQVLKGEKYIESGAQAIDKNEGVVTKNVKIEGDVDTSKAGEYTVTYTATNSKNQMNKRERKVKVVDSMDKDTDGISVMMYHYVYADGAPPTQLNSNFISASSFEAQLKWLKENQYYYPSYQELSEYIKGTHSLPKKSVILTFDDGEEGFLSVGGDLLKKYEIPATSFIIANLPEVPNNLKKYANPYVDFQSHTYALHVAGSSGKGHGGKIFDYNKDQLVDDLKKVQDIVGPTVALAYPFGDVSDVSPAAVPEAGILCAFTVANGQVKKGDDPTTLSRMRVLGSASLASFIYEVENGTG